MPTRITIAEDRAAAAEPTTSSDPPETGHAFTPTGSTLDLFTPKGGAASTPRFGLTRQASKTFGVGDGGRSTARTTKGLSPRPASRQVNNGDIVASPRLLGYLLNFIASLICMVSAIKFERLSQQQYWFDLLVYFSDGRIDHNLTSTNLVLNRGNSTSRLLFVTSTVSHEEQQDFIKGPVASNMYEASMLYDVAVIVGGPETRLFNPHGVRFLQVDEMGNGDNETFESTLLPTSNPSASTPAEVPTSLSEEAETAIAPTNGPTPLSELITDAPTLLGIDSSLGPTPTPTSSRTSPAPSPVTDLSSAAPTSIPTASNLTLIPPIIDEKARPIRAVDYWKMRAAFILPAIGCSITFLIICAHFDNKYFPDVWREIFKDGSRSELFIICSMVAFWVAGLYICTGIHSVGYVQANVFFSSWAAFGTSLMTLKLWRESAGLPSIFAKLVTHSRMTTYNWMWAGVFSTIMLFSLLDLYVHRNSDSTLLGLSLEDVLPQTWRRLWILTGVTTGLCFCVPITNHYLTRPKTERRKARRRFRLIFRQVEGIILLGLLGCYAYIITRYTGVQSPINGINNPYLATWCTFFAIVLSFSTWLRDKKNVAWVHAEGDLILSSITPKKLRRNSSNKGLEE